MKHTEVPYELDNLKHCHILERGDKIVYAAIRSYMNEKTRECFPSLITIAKDLKCSKTKIIKAIERLINADIMKKSEDGKKNHYYFPKSDFDKQFEMFRPEFIKMDLPLNVKEYYMDIQQYLIGKSSGVGKCYYSNSELSKRTGWSVLSVKKYNTILIEKGLLLEKETDDKDEGGFPIIQKNFDLWGLNQAALWAKKITEQTIKNTNDIEELKQELEELRKWKERKEREESLIRNSIDTKSFLI